VRVTDVLGHAMNSSRIGDTLISIRSPVAAYAPDIHEQKPRIRTRSVLAGEM
jgi:hypothetical protein